MTKTAKRISRNRRVSSAMAFYLSTVGGIGGGVVLAASPQSQLVATLPAGKAPFQVGITKPAPEVGISGPQAILCGASHTLYILDQQNNRVLTLNQRNLSATEAGGTKNRGWRAEIGAEFNQQFLLRGLAIANNSVFVLSGDSSAMLVSAASQGGGLESGGKAEAVRPDVLEHFRGLGLASDKGRAQEPKSGVPESGTIRSNVSTQSDARPPKLMIPTSDSDNLRATVRFLSQNQAEILLEASGLQEQRVFKVKSGGHLTNVTPLRVVRRMEREHMFALIEQLSSQRIGAVPSLAVVEVSPSSEVVALYPVPLDKTTFLANQPTAVCADGGVFFIAVLQNRAEIYQLFASPKGISQWNAVPNDTFIAKDSPESGIAQAIPPSYLKPMLTTDVLTAASSFYSISWTVRTHHKVFRAKHGERNACKRRGSDKGIFLWAPPDYVNQAKDGETLTSTPYSWGGSVPAFTVKDQLNDSFSAAGNVCTCDKCAFNETVGVDCSGFISQVWGIANPKFKRSTTSLDPLASPKERPVARRLASYDNIRAGDVLNRAGSHVILVVDVQTAQTGQVIRTLEAHPDHCGGRVCAQPYKLTQLVQQRYIPLRRLNLID